MEVVLQDRFWTICRRFLYSTITDANYHDACVDWTMEEIDGMFTCKDYTSEHECCLFGWKVYIYFDIPYEERKYMVCMYDSEYEENYMEEEYGYKATYEHEYPPYKVKPYHITGVIKDRYCNELVSVTLITDDLPSNVDRTWFIDQWKQKIDVPLSMYLATYTIHDNMNMPE